jgi:hypothetical protein
MRTKALLIGGIATAALALALAGCSTSAGSDTGAGAGAEHSSSASAPESTTRLTGTFAGENGKNVAGTVTITGDTVVLSGFSSDQGPDLHLYLANGTGESDVAAGTEIGAVSYNTASQTFTLASGVDASQFSELVVHCDKAKAVFGAAGLSR